MCYLAVSQIIRKEKMEQYRNTEREIDLQDLFWQLLRHWRAIALCAVIFAILAGALSYMKDNRAAEAGSQNEREVVERLRENLEPEGKSRLLEAESYTDRLRETELWVQENPLAQIDPHQARTVTLQYYIDSVPTLDSEGQVLRDYNADLVNAFAAFVTNEENCSQMAELVPNLRTEDIAYLVSGSYVTDNSFCVKITGTDETMADRFTEFMKTAIDGYSETLRSSMGEHAVVLVNENKSSGISDEFAEYRDLMMTRLSDSRAKVKTLTGEMSEDEMRIYRYDMDPEKEDLTAGTSEYAEATPGVSVKSILVGAVLGIFVVCVWVTLFYVFDGRVKTVSEVESLLPGSFVSEVSDAGSEKKRLFGFVDRWIVNLQGAKRLILPAERQMQILASNIELLSHKREIEQLYVTGTMLDPTDEQIQQLSALLEQKGITLQVVNSVLQDAAALEQMVSSGVVLLWEYEGKSLYTEIVRLLQLCRTQQVNILGAVVVHESCAVVG